MGTILLWVFGIIVVWFIVLPAMAYVLGVVVGIGQVIACVLGRLFGSR